MQGRGQLGELRSKNVAVFLRGTLPWFLDAIFLSARVRIAKKHSIQRVVECYIKDLTTAPDLLIRRLAKGSVLMYCQKYAGPLLRLYCGVRITLAD